MSTPEAIRNTPLPEGILKLMPALEIGGNATSGTQVKFNFNEIMSKMTDDPKQPEMAEAKKYMNQYPNIATHAYDVGCSAYGGQYDMTTGICTATFKDGKDATGCEQPFPLEVPVSTDGGKTFSNKLIAICQNPDLQKQENQEKNMALAASRINERLGKVHALEKAEAARLKALEATPAAATTNKVPETTTTETKGFSCTVL